MLSNALDLPDDPAFAPLRDSLAPDCILEACREQLTRIDSTVRLRWQHARMIESLYHPGRYLRIAYVFVDEASTPPRRHWPEGQIVYINAPVRRPMSRRGHLLQLDGGQVEVYRFPNDRRLRGLRKFTRRDLTSQTWQDWMDGAGAGDRIDPASLQRLLVRYVPEQKWIIRLRAEVSNQRTGETGKRRIAVRSASPESCAELLRRHRAFEDLSRRTESCLQIPQVVGEDVAGGLLAVEWNRGRSLVETLQNQPADEVLRGMAQAVHAFHSVSVTGLPALTVATLEDRVQRASVDLSQARPDLADRLSRLSDNLLPCLSHLNPGSVVTLHNDLHWNQVQIKRQRFGLLDLERMAVGDPWIDVANFVTQLRLLGHRPEHAIAAPLARQWADEFLEQWSRHTGQTIDAARLQCYGVVSALELARGMLRHLRPGWSALADRCVDAAEELLATPVREVPCR